MKKLIRYSIPLFLLMLLSNSICADEPVINKRLKNDIEKVWPLVEIVKTEYRVTTAKCELMDDTTTKAQYLENYESYIKQQYFKKLLKLNVRQGKLFILLIHREIGKTPFELIKNNLSYRRARFWQQIASIAGANLDQKYSKAEYPEIEKEIINLTTKSAQLQVSHIH